MLLFRALDLAPLKHFASAQAAHRSTGSPATSAAVSEPRAPKPVAPPAAGGDGSSDVRAETFRLKGAIELKHHQACETWSKLHEAQPKMKPAIGTAEGELKEQLEAEETLLVTKTADAKKELDLVIADSEAVDRPATRRDELVALLARHKSNANLSTDAEIDVTGLEPYKHSVNKDLTTSTTWFGNCRATVDKVRDRERLGVDECQGKGQAR
jgi:hypothetical protein